MSEISVWTLGECDLAEGTEAASLNEFYMTPKAVQSAKAGNSK